MWDRFQEWALHQVSEVTRAPVAVAVLLGAGAIAGWWAARWFDAEQILLLSLQRDTAMAGAKFVIQQPRAIPLNQFGATETLSATFATVAVSGLAWLIRQRRIDGKRFTENGKQLTELTTKLELAETALLERKRDYAMRTLNRYSFVKFQDGIKPRVTIRYCSYGADYELAKRVKELFRDHVHWDVFEDASNVPPLPRADEFKVVFDVGMTMMTYGDLVHAFSEGNLLGVKVGQRNFSDRTDSENLIVEVLPSADAGAHKGSDNGQTF